LGGGKNELTNPGVGKVGKNVGRFIKICLQSHIAYEKGWQQVLLW
jgi:hypothetical protein